MNAEEILLKLFDKELDERYQSENRGYSESERFKKLDSVGYFREFYEWIDRVVGETR